MPTLQTDYSCAECAVKHLSSAVVIAGEILNGYRTREYAIHLSGNLNEAELQLAALDPLVANAIRQLRHRMLPGGLTLAVEQNAVSSLEELIGAIAEKQQLGIYRMIRKNCCDAASETPTDVLIPLRANGSRAENAELRFALRSIEKHLLNFRKVIVISERFPTGFTDVVFIHHPDVLPRKQMNIHAALKCAMRDPDTADRLLFWADDNVILQNCPVSEIPLVGRPDDLKKYREMPENSRVWTRSLQQTALELEAHGLPTINFEAHTPFLIDREKYLQMENVFNFNRGVGLCYLSLYGNYCRFNPTRMIGEVKATFEKETVDGGLLAGKLFAGYNDTGLNHGLKALLEERFPEKSRFEI